MKKSETSGLLLVSGVMVYWGFTTVMMKHALVYMSSATYIMALFLVASVPLLILYGRKLKGSLSKKLLLHGCILGVLEMIPMQTSTLALHYTSAANSVFVSQLSFVFVPLMQCLLSRKLPNRTLLITIAWLLGGLWVFADVSRNGIGTGIWLSVISALFRSVSILCLKRFAASDDPQLLGVLQVCFCALSSIPVWMVDPGGIQWCPASIGILFFTGILGNAVAFVLYNAGQARTTPIKVSFLNLIQPVFAMLGAAVLVDAAGRVERITSNMMVGSVLILSALSAYLWAERHPRRSGSVHHSHLGQAAAVDHRQNNAL